jgi:hypothetical protein
MLSRRPNSRLYCRWHPGYHLYPERQCPVLVDNVCISIVYTEIPLFASALGLKRSVCGEEIDEKGYRWEKKRNVLFEYVRVSYLSCFCGR